MTDKTTIKHIHAAPRTPKSTLPRPSSP